MSRSIIAVLALLLVGCVISAPVAAEGTTISVWVGHLEAHEALTQAFNEKYPDITVELRVAPAIDGLLTAILGGAAPDVMWLWAGTFYDWARAGILADIGQLADRHGFDLSDFVPTMLSPNTVDGRVVAIPFGPDFVGFTYFNKDAFEEVGLDSTRPPETWSELVEYGSKLVRTEEGEVVRPGFTLPPDGGARGAWTASLFQSGLAVTNPEGTDLTWDTPEAINAWKFWADQRSITGGRMEWGGPFIAGNTPIWIGSSGALGSIQLDAEINWGVGPALTNVRQAVGGSTWNYGLSADSQNLDAAWKWLEFAISPEGVEILNRYTGVLPTRFSIGQLPIFHEDPALRSFVQGSIPYYVDNTQEWVTHTDARREIQPRLERIYRGEIPPTELLEAARQVRLRFGLPLQQ